jgi:hypothetical protein
MNKKQGHWSVKVEQMMQDRDIVPKFRRDDGLVESRGGASRDAPGMRLRAGRAIFESRGVQGDRA